MIKVKNVKNEQFPIDIYICGEKKSYTIKAACELVRMVSKAIHVYMECTNFNNALESKLQSVSPNDRERDEICLWELNSDGFYNTKCGDNFYFDHDVENYLGIKFKVCPFCGRKLSPVS